MRKNLIINQQSGRIIIKKLRKPLKLSKSFRWSAFSEIVTSEECPYKDMEPMKLALKFGVYWVGVVFQPLSLYADFYWLSKGLPLSSSERKKLEPQLVEDLVKCGFALEWDLQDSQIKSNSATVRIDFIKASL